MRHSKFLRTPPQLISRSKPPCIFFLNFNAELYHRSFYSLSKVHHPDHNPNDPDASTRFMEISEAYAILGAPEKRQRYDRDVLKTMSHVNIAPKGSYHSSGPAGGRPASGLSKRRTHFQGPPPSFYRSGGWGDQGAKRQAAQDEANPGNFTGGDGPQGPTAGGMGYGQQPFGPSTDVPHFDREGHFRTHSNHEQRRRTRRMQKEVPVVDTGRGMFGNFIFISSILTLGIALPSMIADRMVRSNTSTSENDRSSS